MLAPINKIIDFSTVDGPGCRTSIFFQKCNIHCLYCHNPETQNLCISCGKCVETCPSHALSFNKDNKVVWNKDKCINCDTCINICPHHASPKIIYLSPLELYENISKNSPFIRGITVSGGECSLYPEFLTELFSLAKKDNLTTLMDSNGMVLLENYPKLMEVCDGVMLDIKSWDLNIYKKLVGFDNSIVKKNLKYLALNNKIEELRIVYVPDYVDAKKCIDGIKDTILDKVKDVKLKLIRFRNNGVKGLLKGHRTPTDSEMLELEEYARSKGFNNIIIR